MIKREMKQVFSLDDFASEIDAITKRGKATLQLMSKMGADQNRLNAEELAISREILHTRIKYTAQFGEVLTQIIQSCQ